jgi:hypothetical protein
MGRLHYLGAIQSNLGKALQYVIEDGVSGEWLALLDWGYGSLKNSARDEWISLDCSPATECRPDPVGVTRDPKRQGIGHSDHKKAAQ